MSNVEQLFVIAAMLWLTSVWLDGRIQRMLHTEREARVDPVPPPPHQDEQKG